MILNHILSGICRLCTLRNNRHLWYNVRQRSDSRLSRKYDWREADNSFADNYLFGRRNNIFCRWHQCTFPRKDCSVCRIFPFALLLRIPKHDMFFLFRQMQWASQMCFLQNNLLAGSKSSSPPKHGLCIRPYRYWKGGRQTSSGYWVGRFPLSLFPCACWTNRMNHWIRRMVS